MSERNTSEPDLALELAGAPPTTVERPGAEAGAPHLLVLEARGLAIYPLPASGTLSIGRAEECQVRLRDPLASRQHATLHVLPLAIEDNGSANGTLLGDRPLEPGIVAPLALGQAISLGNCLLLVRGTAPLDALAAAKSSTRLVAARPHVILQPTMKLLYAVLDQLARGSINVLILGETGVGKELVAEAIHRNSPRSAAPLVRINCAALSEQLLESELFGHERGAFTGAVSAKVGLIETANNGTVFLDEVGELPASLQAKLLRVLEAREVTRVGGVHARPIDVRFISATNKDLEAEVASGAFRPDLMYRLNGAALEIPPLRERPLEVVPLAELFILRVAAQLKLAHPPQLSEEATASLLAHDWPGNVRELRNVVERATLICEGTLIKAEDLSLREALSSHSGHPVGLHASFTKPPADASRETWAPTPLEPHTKPPEDGNSEELNKERARIAHALLECGGNQSRAATFLGIPRRTLVRRIAQLGLPRPRGSND